MQGFKSVGSAQRFLSIHAATYNTFNVQRHLTSARTHRAFRASAVQRPDVAGDLLCARFANVTEPLIVLGRHQRARVERGAHDLAPAADEALAFPLTRPPPYMPH